MDDHTDASQSKLGATAAIRQFRADGDEHAFVTRIYCLYSQLIITLADKRLRKLGVSRAIRDANEIASTVIRRLPLLMESTWGRDNIHSSAQLVGLLVREMRRVAYLITLKR